MTEVVACSLCGLSTHHPLSDDAGRRFCCPACREVSALLAAEPAAAAPDSAAAEPGSTASLVMSVGGLWCTSCAWLVRESLRRMPGVQSAEVSFIQRRARVTYNPERTDGRRLARRVRRLGYRARTGDVPPADEEESHWWRLLISGVFAMHVMLLSFMLYGRRWLGLASADTQWLADFFHLMILVLSLPVMAILGLPILRAGLAGLLRGRPNSHSLIALGAFAAFGLSLRNFINGQPGLYFDTAAVLLFLLALGRWLEMRAHKEGQEAVTHLWEQVPAVATWITAAGERTVPADQLPPGARVRVGPGQHFPADGLVASGDGDVDESLLTGEPEPVTRRPGDRVMAGTTNLDGSFEVIVRAVGADTALGQIGRLLHQALWQRAPVEKLADRLAAWMVPAAALLALTAFLFWAPRLGLETGLNIALAVLLIACPCALGVATPLTLWLGLGRAAQGGVLLRQTAALDALAQARQLYFDKTGTLTTRPLQLQAVTAMGSTEALLWRVAALERLSPHPLAQAIAAGAAGRLPAAAPALPVTGFRVRPGMGISGQVEDRIIWVGNRSLMQEAGLALPPRLADAARAWHQQGLTVVYAGWAGRVQGLLGLGETIRPEVEAVLAALQALDLPVTILTGDDRQAGERWARRLGVPVRAALRPDHKVAELDMGRPSIMVGDGMNDGPVLATAAVGIALAHGADVARTAADVILLHDDLRAVPWLVALARATRRIVRQNLAWAFAYNLVGLGLALAGRLQPEVAALFMVLSNLIVTRNALRLRRWHSPIWLATPADGSEHLRDWPTAPADGAPASAPPPGAARPEPAPERTMPLPAR